MGEVRLLGDLYLNHPSSRMRPVRIREVGHFGFVIFDAAFGELKCVFGEFALTSCGSSKLAPLLAVPGRM